MPASGKSTIGRLLAKKLGYVFLDVDELLVAQFGCSIPDIIKTRGNEKFLKLEAKVIQNISGCNIVISTGGSAIYSRRSIDHLKSLGQLIYIHCSLDELLKRMGDIVERGVIIGKHQTFDGLYNERLPLYRSVEAIEIDNSQLTAEIAVEEIFKKLQI